MVSAPETSNAGQIGDAYMTSTSCAATLTRLELAVLRAFEAFARWVCELNGSVSDEHLSFEDANVLHCLRLRRGIRNLSEILMFMNRQDVSNVQYSLRKLERADLVKRTTGASRREATYILTEHGIAVTDAYGKARQELLVSLTEDIMGFDDQMNLSAAVLERLVGVYDQATQSVLNRRIAGFQR